MTVYGKEKTTPFGINLMRSQVLYWAAQNHCVCRHDSIHGWCVHIEMHSSHRPHQGNAWDSARHFALNRFVQCYPG